MGNMKMSFAGLAVLVSGSAAAADTAFENHLTSTSMVSPAQIYQVEDTKTDFALGYKATTDSSKAKGQSEEKLDTTGTNLFAGGIYNIKAIGLRTGLSVNYGNMDQDTLSAADAAKKITTENTEMTVSPQAAYVVGPIALGAAADIVQRTAKVEELEEAKSNHVRFRPGMLFTNDTLEAGLTYSSPNRRTAEKLEELAVMEPARLTAHGRLALSDDLAVGAILGNVNWKPLDEARYKDQTIVKGTGEFAAGPVKVEGEVGYNTAFYKDADLALSEATIGTFVIGAAGDYEISKAAAIGGGVGYEFGSDQNDAVEIAKNTLTVSVRGNMKF